MRAITIVGSALLACFLQACPPQNVRPISNICRYDGAHSGTVVKVICTGIGSSQESALIDAKKAATGYVVSRLLQTPYERDKFGAIANSFYRRYNKFLAKVRTDGTYKQDDEGKSRVEAFIEVRRDQVVAYLTDSGIINPHGLRKAIGNPMVAVTARWEVRDPRWDSFVRGAANTFFTERQYNTIDLESQEKLLDKVSQRVLKMEGVPIDKKYRAAMMLGADIYFEVTCWNEQKGAHAKGAARVKAYETSTSRLLGDETGFGREFPKGNQIEFQTVKEAIQNTMQRVLTQVSGYWKRDVEEGNRFFVMFVGNIDKVEDMGDQMVLTLKRYKEISEVQCPTVTKNRIPCHFRSKKDPTELRLSLKSVLRQAPGVGSIDYLLKTRKFFILSVNHATTAANASVAVDSDNLPPGM